MKCHAHKALLALGAIAMCACSVLRPIHAPAQTPMPSLPPLEIQDVVVHHSLSADAQIHDWGLKIYDASQTGVGFVRPEDQNTPPAELPQNDELRLTEGQSLSLYLVLSAGEQAVFLVTALLDYNQAPFTLDGQQGLLHQVTFEPGGDLYVPVQIEILGPGAHDLIFAVFKNPYDRPMDHTFRSNQRLFGSRRTVVIVGDDERPVRAIQPDAVGVPPPPDIDWGARALFATMPNTSDHTHPSEPDRQLPLAIHAQPGQTFAYQLWSSNVNAPELNPVDCGYLRFLNYHQIDFRGKNLFVVRFHGGQEIILEDSLILPAQAGVNEVQIIYVFDPYKSLLRKQVAASFVFGSPCLGIEVP